ncbi:SHOCT domain-containing protein [Lactobacillus sp. M0390]|uniref:SHOCT domain-containing protein n=1 Tax=Lactobacillus sp. M0390 TaxID=2751026 RepID=UPI0018DD6778|nr:SHOCT domain-containing protein [Lactobacillus sp. M0390]MBH9985035.1 SHOCT domain-containing protein [Lactobacillus sp. M0390]
MKVEIKVPEHTIVEADDTGVTITHKGLRAFGNHGKVGSTKIPYWQIVSIDFRKSTGFGGKFQINAASGPQKSLIGGNSAYGSTTGIVFRNGKNKEMLALKEFVEEKISKVHQNHANSSSESIDTADQIKKFKQLADDGIITQDEFEAKKERLLNL